MTSQVDDDRVRTPWALLTRYPDFRRLWLGNLISLGGDWVGWVAVSLLALEAENGVLQLALMFLAHHLPSALLAPLGGSLADRFDRRKILLVVAVGQGVLTLGMAVCAATGALFLVQVLLVFRSGATAFMVPTERASLPRLVPASALLLANAVDSATWSVMFALGMAVGGVVAMLGTSTALYVDALTFAVAVFFYARLPAMVPGETTERPANHDNVEVSGQPLSRPGWSKVWSWLWQRPVVLRGAFAKMPMAIASGSAWVGLNLIAHDPAVGLPASLALGTFHGLRGVGTGVGPLVAERLSLNSRNRVPIWMAFFAISLLGLLLFTELSTWWIWAPAAFMWGLGGGVNWVFSTEVTQREVPDIYRGRVGAIDTLAWMGAQSAAVAATAYASHEGIDFRTSVPWAAVLAVVLIVALNLNAMRRKTTSS